ncbi:SufE family protein [Alteromonas sp. P256]|uniref:SufE family protein n=1 Tax=Alteromonas sp. P256 TaxID=3117399 RepID=UPI002FE00633
MTLANMQLLPLAQQLSQAKSWDEFTRTIMLAGKKLPAMPEHLRRDANSVEGCESPVWLALLHFESSESGERGEINSGFVAYSPSKVIRGVLAILLEKANSLEQQERANFDFGTYLNECQLQRYMSESRGNGIKSVVRQLKVL